MTAAGARAEVKRRFAGREAAIDVAFRESPVFRTLCGDFVACVRALEHWQASVSEQAPQRAAEYADLLAELTHDIEAHLGTHEP